MRAIGIGNAGLDVTRYNDIELKRVGGSCTNILLHLASMGWDCTMCHMKGNDDVAEYIEKDLRDGGVKSAFIEHKVSSRVLIINSADGQHEYQRVCDHGNNTMTNHTVVSELEKQLDPECDVFVFDQPWQSVVDYVSRTSGMKWFEAYERDSHEKIWRMCAGMADMIKSADVVSVPNGSNMIVTDGSSGLKYIYNGTRGEIESTNIPNVVDPCGCGDCVSACCIDALCTNKSIRYGLERGVRLAALNCCYPGPRSMLDSTTSHYRDNIMDGKPIMFPPEAVYKSDNNLKICSCENIMLKNVKIVYE